MGAAAYNGDLTQKAFYFKQLRPAVGLNLKYNTNSFFNLRAGLAYARLTASDKDNKDPGLKSRNLNFTTDIIEFHAGGELNLLDPELFYGFPTCLPALAFFISTRILTIIITKNVSPSIKYGGQGLPEYPGRKKYSQVQLCIPMGGGWKFKLKKNMEVCYEFGYRLLFTDYLDDVSKTYPPWKYLQQRGDVGCTIVVPQTGYSFYGRRRGQGQFQGKDLYFFSSVKLAINLNRFSKIKTTGGTTIDLHKSIFYIVYP